MHRFAPADIFQFWLARLTVSSFAQIFEFLGFQFAHFAWLNVEHQRAVTHAANFLDVVADLFEHLAQLAVAAFNQNDFVPGVVALTDFANLGGRGLHPAGAGLAALDANARTEAIQRFLGGLAAHLNQVGLLHACRSAGELVSQVAVVGYKQEAFAQIVQATDGVEPLAQLREELHHGWTPLWIADRGYKAARLVEHEVAQALGALQQFAVDANMIAGGISLGAEFRDDFAVHLHASLGDQIFGVPAARNSGLGENLLQALEFARDFRLGNEVDFFIRFRCVSSAGIGVFGNRI
jgi:hypothetical protein